MRFKTSLKFALLTTIATNSAFAAAFDSDTGWYLRAHTGLSFVDDTSGETRGIGSTNGSAKVDLDSGFLAGMALGYRYNAHWGAEIAWEYRSNDSETTLADGSNFDDGNYASNAFYINGLYHFPMSTKWETYIGAGLGWLQEIDLDLETMDSEISYSGDGRIGGQIFGGVNYLVNDQWVLNGELRYADFGEVDLDGEAGASGNFDSLEYSPLSVQLGIAYRF